MQQIHAMGSSETFLDQLDLVELVKKHIDGVKIELIQDLDVRFGVDSSEPCWIFGSGCEDVFGLWVEEMKKDGFIFEKATLLIDAGGQIAGVWPKDETVPVIETEAPSVIPPVLETKAEAISKTNISASVVLVCTDENGIIKRLQVRGSYRKRQEANYFAIVDLVDIDTENDLNKDDLAKLQEWTNECEVNLLTYSIEGPAYLVDQDYIHTFGIVRVCLDNLHAVVLDKMIEVLQKTRDSIRPRTSAAN
jgi:hypothetical protein